MSDDLFEDEPEASPQRKKSLQQTVIDLQKMDTNDRQDGVLHMSESKILLRRDPLAPQITNRYKSPVFDGNILVMKQ